MRETVVAFIHELREAGVAVSPAETLDALRAVAVLGVAREEVREGLAVALVKDVEDRGVFDQVFARFFVAPAGNGRPPRGRGAGAGGIGERPGRSSGEAAGGRRTPSLQEPHARVAAGRETEHEARGKAGERPHDGRIAAGTTPRVGAARRRDAGGHRELQRGRTARRAELLRRPFHALDSREVEECRAFAEELGRRLARRLRRRFALGRRGRIDIRRTIRASVSHGGAFVELRRRRPRPHPPDLVALCDLSGSVASASDFLLALLAPAQAVFRRVRTFAFVDRLVPVAFEAGHVIPEAPLDLYAHSDFGAVLQQFARDWADRLITRGSVLLVLGDARNNRRPPRSDLLAQLHGRCRRLIWLNPEPRARWNQADSDIGRYARCCDAVFPCENLAELLAAVRDCG